MNTILLVFQGGGGGGGDGGTKFIIPGWLITSGKTVT